VKTIGGADFTFFREFFSLPVQSVPDPNRVLAIDGAPEFFLLFFGKSHVVLQKIKLCAY
jgi:hypothetical protein